MALDRRVITRLADAGGEDHEAVEPSEFKRRRAQRLRLNLMVWWCAYDLDYGLLRGSMTAGASMPALSPGVSPARVLKRRPGLSLPPP